MASSSCNFLGFRWLTRRVIRGAALQTSGAAGPSGVDAYTMVGDDYVQVCCSIAVLARRLCNIINFVDHAIVVPLLACSCRLIALDKDPGVRPILVLVRLLDELLLRLRSLSNNSISYWC